MCIYKQTWRNNLFIVCSLCLLAMVVMACAPAAAPGGQGSAPAASASEQGAAPATEQVKLRLQMADPGTEIDFNPQIEQLKVDYNIELQIEVIPYREFIPKLLAQLAAGTAPDIVALSHEDLVALQAGESLLPLDDLIAKLGDSLALDDFLPNPLESNQVDGKLFGLPWYRGLACSPWYVSLAVLKQSGYADSAFHVIDFLTQPTQQEQNGKITYENSTSKQSERLLLPTRKSVYEKLGFTCPDTGKVATLSPKDHERAIQVATDRAPNLQPIVEKNFEELKAAQIINDGRGPQTINPQLATAAVMYQDAKPGEPRGFENADEPQGTMLAVAAPVTLNFSKEEFEAALQSNSGVIVGAFFGVDEPLYLELADGEFTIDPGVDYAVKWRADTQELNDISVYLIDSNSPDSEKLVGKITLQPLNGATIQPFVTIEIGSCHVCYYIDDEYGCAWIRNEWLSWYRWYKTVIQGATITSEWCN